MYMILPDFVAFYSCRALQPVDHHLPWHVYLCECKELQDIHHQYQEEAEVQEEGDVVVVEEEVEEEDFSSL